MKLIYLANIRLPTERAHGLQIMKTCEAFAKIGVDVELVVPTRDNLLSDDPFTYYGIERRFKLTVLPAVDLVRFGPFGFLASSVDFARRAYSIVNNRDADILYSRDSLVLLGFLAKAKKMVYEAHAKPSFAGKIVARRVRLTVVISQGLAKAYQAIGLPHKRLLVAPDAVDAEFFDGAPAREAAKRILNLSATPLVVYTGHLYARKGVDTLAKAAELLPDALIVFVGGTSLDVANFTERWGSKRNIRIIGHVQHEKIPTYMRAADVLVLPNSGSNQDAARLTSPMKLFEYMASGTPIVASDVPSVREILDEKTACLVTPDNPVLLSEAINALFNEPDRGERLAKVALERAREYTWEERAIVIRQALK